VILFAYAAYWAFRVEGAMFDRLYRGRAFWVGLVALLFAILVSSNLIIGGLAPNDWPFSLLQFSVQFAGAAVTFACIDSAIRVARRSDPLNRDSLRWRTLRKLLWFVVLATISGELGGVVLGHVNFFSSPGGPQGSFLYGPFGNLLGLIALALSRSRSKDVTLRAHMKWFGFFVLLVLVITQDPVSRLPYSRIIVEASLLPSAYFLYNAARSLVSVARVPKAGRAVDELAPAGTVSPGRPSTG
jgi:hypothetical protein